MLCSLLQNSTKVSNQGNSAAVREQEHQECSLLLNGKVAFGDQYMKKKQIACMHSLTESDLNITVMFRTADPAVCCSPGKLDEALVAAGWYIMCLAATRRDLQLCNFWVF